MVHTDSWTQKGPAGYWVLWMLSGLLTFDYFKLTVSYDAHFMLVNMKPNLTYSWNSISHHIYIWRHWIRCIFMKSAVLNNLFRNECLYLWQQRDFMTHFMLYVNIIKDSDILLYYFILREFYLFMFFYTCARHLVKYSATEMWDYQQGWITGPDMIILFLCPKIYWQTCWQMVARAAQY